MSNLQDAKRVVNINTLWHRYNFPGELARSCKSPFREDKHNSFSVYRNYTRWKDFSTGLGGDQIAFLAEAEDIDNRTACKLIKKIALESHPGIILKKPKKRTIQSPRSPP